MKPRLPQAPFPILRPSPPARDQLALDYQSTNEQIKLLTDIRFRLLAFTPPLVGVASAILSVGLGPAVAPPILILSIAVFGFFATLGVILYDLRNSELYDAHIHRATLIERALKMQSHSAFAPPGSYAGPHTLRMWQSGRFLGFDVSHGAALSVVYAAILAAWVYPASRGLLVFFAPFLKGLSPSLIQLATKLVPDFGSGKGNTTALLALLLAAIFSRIFYTKLRGADIPGLAEACVYDDVNEARSKVRNSYEEMRLSLLRCINNGNTDLGRLKEGKFSRVIDTLAKAGFIQVEEEDNVVSLTETGQKLVLDAESKLPTNEGSEFGSGA
jgi:hypothetical protein